MRNADQFEVGEHDAGALAAVVEQHVDTGRRELVVQSVGRRADLGAALIADCGNGDAERRHRGRPDDAAIIVVLLDGGGDHARDADAVATHFHDLLFLFAVQETGAQREGIALPEREHVSDLDAAPKFQAAAAVGRRVALDDVADVGDDVGFRAVTPPIGAGQVIARLVGAADEVGHRGRRAVGDNQHAAGVRLAVAGDGAAITGFDPQMRLDLLRRRRAEIGQFGKLA